MTLSELIDALPNINRAKSHCVERLMRILIHSKFFTKVEISEDKQGYWLTPSSLHLIKDEPMNVTPFVLAMLDPILTDPWNELSEWFKTVDPTPFLTTHGKTLWEQAEKDLRLNQLFNESMASDTVGLKCSVLELPHVVASLEGTQNLTFVVGDMFDSIPPADAVFMKWILHDWPDEECVKILKKCKEAIPGKDKGGKVIIVDMVVGNQRDHNKKHDAIMETQLFYDMLMMILTSGRKKELRKIGQNSFMMLVSQATRLLMYWD
ncbi:hypothetical protein DH2020_011437 [Rehmannia glutinosa]|uniref:O-methyltransferase C-terminal domain-containing protein n=1 Tax=Rehmannia glutinosa TaxID=99300 RepID=A0ABR0XDE7_REHGL